MAVELTGTVQDMEHTTIGGHEKTVLTLATGFQQQAFIEFRGNLINLLDGVKPDDEVKVSVKFQGKVSKSSGIRYNNLFAKELSLIKKSRK